MNKLWIPMFAIFSVFNLMAVASVETYDQWEDPSDDAPGLQHVQYQESYEQPACHSCTAKPSRLSSFRQKWVDNGFAEKQFQDTGWPGRRDDELSDQLSR